MQLRAAGIALTLLGVLGCATSVHAQIVADQDDALRGIQAMYVLVMNDDWPKELQDWDIAQLIEGRVRQAGITVSTGAPIKPALVLTVQAYAIEGLKGSLWVFKMELIVKEVAIPTRAPLSSTQFLLETWSSSRFGTTGRDHLRTAIRSSVEEMLDDFVNAYLKANPKTR